MRFSIIATVSVVALAGASPAFAISCKEEISTIERRLNSSGAEQVTGKEPAGGATSSNSPKALDKAPDVKPSDPATQPSAGGVNEARKLVEKAKGEEKAGQEQACQATMTKAKEAAGVLP